MSAVGSGSSACSRPQRSWSVPCSSSTSHVEPALGLRVDAGPVDPVLLRLEAERVPPGLLHLVRLAVGDEPAERVPVRDELLVVEPAVEEVLPPLRPLLALVVVEQVREQPVGVALLGAGEERVADARPLGVALLRLLAPLALVRRQPPRHLRRPPLEQPAVQLVERDAVLLVVVADPVEERVVAGLEPRLEGGHRLAPAPDLGRALEAEELLDLLDRVARHRRAQRLLRHAEEVDEHLAAEEVVDLLLARAVLAHEPRERGALVRRVVVDVHAREAAAALDDVVDEPLEALLLGFPVARPDVLVARRAVLAELDPAEEVLEPARRLEPGVALEVEPDVAGARLRQEREAAVGLLGEVLDHVLARAPVVELEPRLVVEALEGGRAHARDLGVGVGLGERLERRDPGRLEPLDLEPRDAGDEREVVVLRPALLAEREEVAEPAEVDRVGVGRPPPLDRVEKPRAEPAVVGEEVVRPEGLALPRARDDVHRLRACAPGSARAARCRSRAGARAAAWRGGRAWCRRPRIRRRRRGAR